MTTISSLIALAQIADKLTAAQRNDLLTAVGHQHEATNELTDTDFSQAVIMAQNGNVDALVELQDSYAAA